MAGINPEISRNGATSDRAVQEQAALLKIATMVARDRPRDEVFQAAVDELRSLLNVAHALLLRYEDDGSATMLAHSVDDGTPLALGTVLHYEEGTLGTTVRETGQSARSDDTVNLPSPLREKVRELGVTGAVKVPVLLDGRVWGVLSVGWRWPVPADTEDRMQEFTELLAVAVAHAESRAQLIESREHLAALVREQDALRRIATLVAEGAPTQAVLDAVARQAWELLNTDGAVLQRFNDDDTATVVTVSDPEGFIAAEGIVGMRRPTNTSNLISKVRASGRAEIVGSLDDESSLLRSGLGGTGIMGAIGVPVVIDGQLWGMASIAWRTPVSADLEYRLTEFTSLLSTAIANADSRRELDASRRRVITSADQARHRIERDLHDGVQQRLIALTMDMRAAEDNHSDSGDIARVRAGMNALLDELREIVAGIDPPVLRNGGLPPALRTLARRSPIPVRLDVQIPGRLPEPAEIAGYYVVSEALANAAKHSRADRIRVQAGVRDDRLRLVVSDDGAGGATAEKGTGLIGLRDRVEAIGGIVTVHSPPGRGTVITTWIPLEAGC
jgi:signal transduction histidine kinase